MMNLPGKQAGEASPDVSIRALMLLWALGSAVALAFALRWLPSTAVEGVVLPSGHDALYHAARIQDVVEGRGLAQFDTRIHAPEGSWVPWPWGYDLALGWLAMAGMALTGAESPIRVLIWVPPLWVLVNVALVLGIVTALRLSFSMRVLAVGCYVFSPLTQLLHGAGRIDHHFAEQTAVLLVLLLGLRWLDQPDRAGRAALLGGCLALVGAIHNGLFLLQIPVVIGFLVLWIRRASPQPRATLWFATALICLQIVISMPSLPFRNGVFSYHFLSWFHLNVALGTAVVAIWTSRFEPRISRIAALGVVGAVLAIPLLRDVFDGLSFLRVDIQEIQVMGETHGLLRSGQSAFDFLISTKIYTALILILPLIALWSLIEIFRNRNPVAIYFHVFSVCGALILLQQFRFHQLGSFSLFLPLLFMADKFFRGTPSRAAVLVLAAGLIAAYTPVGAQLMRVPHPTNSSDYVIVMRIFPPLAEACRNNPGIVLADPAEGHPIRFHTRCSVIANHLILTPVSREKVVQANYLLRLSAEQLRLEAPWVRYVVARRQDNLLNPALSQAEILQLNRGVREELLLRGVPPPGYSLIGESLVVVPPGREVAAARVFRLDERPALSPQ